MRKIIFFLFSTWILYAQNYSITVKIKDWKLKNFCKIAKVEFLIKGKIEEWEKIGVFDDKGNPVPFIVKEIDENRCILYFKISESRIYRIISNQEFEFKNGIENIPEGKIIIDDYLLPDSKKSGCWIWKEEPVISGDFSHTDTGKNGISYHSTTISPLKVRQSDFIIQYLFIDPENVPEEIMIGIKSGRSEKFFSWGKDKIRWRNIDKEYMGKLPSAGKWERISIPLKDFRRRKITGISFYHYGGRVFWDLTTLNQTPLQTEIIKFENGKFPVSYFTLQIRGPVEIKKKKFYILELDGSPSSGDIYRWEINGNTFYGKKISCAVNDKKDVSICLEVEDKNGNKDRFEKKILLPTGKINKLKILLKPLPHTNFIYPGEKADLPFTIINLSPFPLNISIKGIQNNGKIKLLPGMENSKVLHFNFIPGYKKEEKEISVWLGDLKIENERILFSPVSEIENLNVKGPYFKNDRGDFVVLIIPDYELKQKQTDRESKIYIVGDFPKELINELKERTGSDFKVIKFPQKGYHILTSFLTLFKNSFKDSDTVIFFPPLLSILRKTPFEEWKKGMDAILYIFKKAGKVIVLSPFPSLPDLKNFLPYVNILKEISSLRNAEFIDLYSLYTSIDNWKRFFMVNNNIYSVFPNKEGTEILAEEILKKLEWKGH